MFDRFSKTEKDTDAKKAEGIKPDPFVTRFATYCRTSCYDTEFLGHAYYEAYQSQKSTDKWHVNLVVEEDRDGKTVVQYHPIEDYKEFSFLEAMEELSKFDNQQIHEKRPVIAEVDAALEYRFVYESEGLYTDVEGMPAMPYNEHTYSAVSRTFYKSEMERAEARHNAAKSEGTDINPLPNYFTEVFNQLSKKGNYQEKLKALEKLGHLDGFAENLLSLNRMSARDGHYFAKTYDINGRSKYQDFTSGILPFKHVKSKTELNAIESYYITPTKTDCYRIKINDVFRALKKIKKDDKALYDELYTLTVLITVDKLARLCARMYKNLQSSGNIDVDGVKSINSINDDIKMLLKDHLKVSNPDAAFQRISDHIASNFDGKNESLALTVYDEYQTWRDRALQSIKDGKNATPALTVRVPKF